MASHTLGGGQPSLDTGPLTQEGFSHPGRVLGQLCRQTFLDGPWLPGTHGLVGWRTAPGHPEQKALGVGPRPTSALELPLAALRSVPGCLLCALLFIWPRAGSGTWSPSRCEEMGVGGSLVLPQDDRMALGPETMGPGRGQVLDPGQEKDDLKINTDPPRGLELGLQRLSFPGCPTEPEGEGAGVGVGGGQRESTSRGTIVTPLNTEKLSTEGCSQGHAAEQR